MNDRYVSKDLGMMKLVDKIEEGFFIKNYYIYKRKTDYIMKARGIIKKIKPVINTPVVEFKLLSSIRKKKPYDFISKESKYRYVYEIKK